MRKLVFSTALIFWLAAVSGGMYAMTRLDFRAGPKSAAPKVWPSSTRLHFDDHSYNLVLSLHPKCSCSNATLAELAKIIAASENRLRVHALVSLPADAPQEWRNSELVEQLRMLPHTEIAFDEGGQETANFGTLTSGDTILFSPHKEKIFRGGITESRGHSGDNAGEESIVALIRGENIARHETPVFGCSLHGEKESRP